MTPHEIQDEFRRLSIEKDRAAVKFNGFTDVIAPDFAPRKIGETITDPKHGEVSIRRVYLYADWRYKLYWKYVCNNVKKGGYIGRRTYVCLEPLNA